MLHDSRRDFVSKTLALGTALGLGSATQPAQGKATPGDGKPNVLLIMTDTQRKDDMGAYGNPVIRTPHLDALANTGVRFDNCFTQTPACMPARATLFTGRYPMAHGVWSNGVPLPESETTLAHVFARSGYRTGGAGKFHLVPHYPYRSALPTMENHPKPFYGFQEFHLGEDGRSGEQWQWLQKNHPEYHKKPDDEIPVELHNSYWTASHTIEFIKSCAADDAPFFAFCSFVDPHQPYNPPSPYREMYDPEAMPPPLRREGELDNSRFKQLSESRKRYNDDVARERAQHYAEMTFIDDSVGRVLETLDDLQLRENTLIVFVADHGDMLGDHWLWWKGAFHYSGCSHVPLFFSWPGRLKEGKVVDGIVQQTDVLPSILELAGLEIPPGCQGKSLAPVSTTDTEDTGYEFAYIESISSGAWHPEFIDHTGKKPEKRGPSVDTLTVRNAKWRFTLYTGEWSGTPGGELYDLEDDPNEFVNRWEDAAYQKVRSELTVVLLNRLAATRDPLPQRTKPF